MATDSWLPLPLTAPSNWEGCGSSTVPPLVPWTRDGPKLSAAPPPPHPSRPGMEADYRSLLLATQKNAAAYSQSAALSTNFRTLLD